MNSYKQKNVLWWKKQSGLEFLPIVKTLGDLILFFYENKKSNLKSYN